jgi:DNA-binding response OmpR family regulator
MSRLLVVDDEERIRQLMRRVLESEGYVVDTAATGSDGLDKAAGYPYGLVVLDLMLPDMSGSDVLAGLLAGGGETRRVLVVSAVPEIGQRVRVLDMGALDFLPKPFAIAELLARIRARLRDPAQATTPRMLLVGELRLDTQRRVLVDGDRTVPLSQREYLLLNHLMRRAGEVCSREELLNDVWGYRFDPGSNVVDVYVRRLRAKLDATEMIETVRNVGYCLVAG